MNAKENFLRAIYCQDPEYVPRTDEDTIAGFEFKGNFQMEDWADNWGVHWKITRTYMVPFLKGIPYQIWITWTNTNFLIQMS